MIFVAWVLAGIVSLHVIGLIVNKIFFRNELKTIEPCGNRYTKNE